MNINCEQKLWELVNFKLVAPTGSTLNQAPHVRHLIQTVRKVGTSRTRYKQILWAILPNARAGPSKQWYFGMKAHTGVDSQTKLIHSAAVTAANVHDSQLLGDLMHSDETRLYGDSAYAGQGVVMRTRAARVKDFTNKKSWSESPTVTHRHWPQSDPLLRALP